MNERGPEWRLPDDLDADGMWDRAQEIFDRYRDQAPSFVARQIDSQEKQGKAEGARIWRSIAWRVAELRRRAATEAVRKDPFGG